jgi:hypothetical protein
VYVPQQYAQHHTVPEAQALFGVDLPNLVQNTISAVVSIALKLKEFVLDGIAWTIAKAIVARMVASLVDWINSGFKGSPAFITDLGQFLLEAADEEAGRYIESLGGDASFLCDPFKLDIQIALAVEYDNIREDRPYEGCKISDMVTNVDEFFSGTFNEGGWKDWITITQEPEKYTPYGQMLEAEQGLARNLAKTADKEKRQLDWGAGFKSTKICENVENPNGGTTLRCNIATPGRTISESLSKALGAGTDTLVTADEISEVVGALIAQLANKAITGTAGLLGLSAGTGHTYRGYSGGSYTGAASAEASNQGGAQNGNGNLTILSETLKVQEDYKVLADTQIPLIQAYLANSSYPIEKKQVADTYLKMALEVQQNAPKYITNLRAMVSSYTALEAEFNNANTAPSRKDQIPQEELNIMDQYANIGFYTQTEYDSSRTSWDTSTF